MPVTKQIYPIPAPWSTTGIALQFRQAFIDAGLMTDWFDSFSNSGNEHRILRIVYDNARTYGTTFYWFVFASDRVSVHFATGWNTTTKLPTGTQWIDWATTAAGIGGFFTFGGGRSQAISNELIRYTSQINTGFSFFIFRQGGITFPFAIAPPSWGVASWIDLDRTMFHHFISPNPFASNSAAGLIFVSHLALRRSFCMGSWPLGDNTTRTALTIGLGCYSVAGKTPNNITGNAPPGCNFSGIPGATSVILPTGETDANPAYATDSNPVFTNMPVTPYMTNSNLPADFAIIPHYANNTMASLDIFVVTPGVEEWELLTVANNATNVTGASIAFAARTI